MKILMIILFFLLTANQSKINTDPSGHIDKDRCVWVYDEQHDPQEIKLYGRVKIVEFGETFKVARVPIGEDLKVKTSQIPQQCGEWQIVEMDEDFSVKFVEVGEDFTVRFVDVIE